MFRSPTPWYDHYNKIIIKSTDGGNNWNTVFFDQTGGLFSVFFTNNNTGYCSGGEYLYWIGQILKTTNSGINWFYKSIPGNSHGFVSVFFPNMNTGYVGIYRNTNFYYKTTNSGDNWLQYSLPDTGDGNDIFFINSDTGFILCSIITGSRVLRTSNGGINWSVQASYVSNSYLYSIKFVNSQTGFVGGYENNEFIDKSTNGGLDWFRLTIPINSNFFIKSICFVNVNTGYAVGNGFTGAVQLIKTTNSGVNWYELGPPSSSIFSVYFINENTGFILSDLGHLFKTTTGGEPLGIKSVGKEMPKTYSLIQNYPNPFNPSTTIEFDIPKTTFTKLIIYDITGRGIGTIVSEELKAGTYKINFEVI